MKIGDRVKDISDYMNNVEGVIVGFRTNGHDDDEVQVKYDDDQFNASAWGADELEWFPVEDYEIISENSTAVVSSGEKRTFPSGAQRDDVTGKERLDFIDPEFELRFAKHLTAGAEHYGDYNWVKGIPSTEYMASLLRHVRKHRAGWRDEDHLSAAAFNIMGLMRNEGTELDDLFDWKAK